MGNNIENKRIENKNYIKDKKYVFFRILVTLSLLLLCTYLITNLIYYVDYIKIGTLSNLVIAEQLGIIFLTTYSLMLFSVLIFLILYIFKILERHKILKNSIICLFFFILFVYMIQGLVSKFLWYLNGTSSYLSTIITTAICISLLIALYVIYLIKTIKHKDSKFINFNSLALLLSIIAHLILYTVFVFQTIYEYTSLINNIENDLLISLYKILLTQSIFELTINLITLLCVVIFTILHFFKLLKSNNISKTYVISFLLAITIISFIHVFATNIISVCNELTSAPYNLYMIIISPLCAISFTTLYIYYLYLQRKYQNIQTDQTEGST